MATDTPQSVPRLHHVSGAAAESKYNLPSDRNLFGVKTVTLHGTDPVAKKEEFRQYFHDTFELYEKVFDCLKCAESFLIKPVHKLRHPLIFYYGHTATFYMNKMVVAGLTTRINPGFEEKFAVGVDEMSWDDLNDAHYNWPTIEEVSLYRQQVRDRIESMIRSGKFDLKLPLRFDTSADDDHNAFWWVIAMGCEHERIHLETASVHVRELPARLVRTEMSAFWRRCTSSCDTNPKNEMVEVSGGKVVIGRQSDSAAYGWDCDYSDKVTETVAPFKASKFLVSNAEFFAFIKAKGYETREFWDDEGWNWVQWKRPEHPWFWIKDPAAVNGYRLRLQTEEINIPWDWPCEVNHLEAHAFCRFKSLASGRTFRLLTEAEWLLLHDRFVKQDQFEWGTAPGNVNLEHFQSSCPVNMFPQGPFFDIVGNVWQHTETPVYPYSGYKVHPFYDDFSLPTFDGRHYCMKGGAWISTGNEATRDARYAFRRHFFQYIGIRYVEGEPVPSVTASLNSTVGMDAEVDAQTDFAYRVSAAIPNSPHIVANVAWKLFTDFGKTKPTKALDLACGAGRVSFELAQHFAEVIGSDTTARRLIPAFSMKERGVAVYSVVNKNGQRERREVRASDFPSWTNVRERAYFYQADPSNLHGHMDHFDLIVAWNDVIARSYNSSAIAGHLVSRLNRGGILVIVGNEAFNPSTGLPESVLAGTAEVVGAPLELAVATPHDDRSGSYKVHQVVTLRKL